MEELYKLMKSGWDISISKVLKHIEEENSDWSIRYCWKAQAWEKRYECEWEGFITPEECINNLITTLKDK